MRAEYSTRLVFIFKTFVIKIPISKRGYLQGINEKFIWDKYKDIAPLAELKWMHLGIVCQVKCKPLYTKHPLKFNSLNKVSEAKLLMEEFNFTNCDLYNPDNWGMYNDKVVLLDYGITEAISKMYKPKKK
jgi:hypothetical protein